MIEQLNMFDLPVEEEEPTSILVIGLPLDEYDAAVRYLRWVCMTREEHNRRLLSEVNNEEEVNE